MSILILTKGAKSSPKLYCDHCGHLILDPTMANAIWVGHPRAEGLRSEINYVHKECDHPFVCLNPAPGNYLWMWQNLDQHFKELFPPRA